MGAVTLESHDADGVAKADIFDNLAKTIVHFPYVTVKRRKLSLLSYSVAD